MADAPKSSAEKPPAKINLTRDISILVAIMVIGYVSANITPVNFDTVTSGTALSEVWVFFQNEIASLGVTSFFVALEPILGTLAIVFLAGIFFSRIKGNEVHHKEHEQYAPIVAPEVTAKEKMIQWQVVLDHVNSESPAEWKLAILEADNMLDEILEDQGYVGNTVAEKLQAMSPGRIASYNAVWEAHKLRNQIAHGGALDMDISKKIALDTIAKFGNAFRDLGYI
jgi:hypothetical protein